MTSNSLVIAAAGSSSRMGLGTKKEYLPLKNGTVLSESLRAFLEAADFSEIVISVPPNGIQEAKAAVFSDSRIKDLLKDSRLIFSEGGKTRQESVFKALCKISDQNSTVLIHDGARPFVSAKIIQDVLKTAHESGAAVPAIPPVDTQKEISPDGTIKRHLVRKNIGAVQTPQGFHLAPLILCHQKAAEKKYECTDDSELWDSFPEFTEGKKVRVVAGCEKNKKITFLQDIEKEKEMIRIGMGTDLHCLAEGRKFFLGGVEIPCEKGELGNSDGDVLLHAVSDALLGASCLGDIGSYFPPEDPKWKDSDSAVLLKKIWNDVRSAGWNLVNMDCVVETESPKLLPWREKIINSIAQILETDSAKIFVKAKTNEKQDSVGAGNAIKAYCVCLLQK
ncbi:2-C-methyl-D-erythritol 4-phosphate cytidylyltransferase [Treponema sp.]|uniref:2-C-methyl-D-erythritol 4-phosphate cytidylyltransferase n=1 Tax=Treponema sp. TaxID=166 RepID=UPI003F009078